MLPSSAKDDRRAAKVPQSAPRAVAFVAHLPSRARRARSEAEPPRPVDEARRAIVRPPRTSADVRGTRRIERVVPAASAFLTGPPREVKVFLKKGGIDRLATALQGRSACPVFLASVTGASWRRCSRLPCS